MTGQTLATAVLLAWTPVVVALFRLIGRRNGTLAAVVCGYLFLPRHWLVIAGPRQSIYFEKQAAIGLALAVAMLVWDARLLVRFRPKLWDVPFLAFTAWVSVVAVAGQYAEYSVADLISQRRVWWVFPYLAGRLYFGDTDGARRVLSWVVLASLALAPAVFLEATAGPSWAVNSLLYGVSSGMTVRLGGWRPEVFFDHGIELSCWMALASVSALWLLLGGAWRGRRWVAGLALLVLLPATAMTRGVYGYIDLAVGAAVVLATLSLRTRAFLVLLALAAPLYMGLRVSGAWDGRDLLRPLAGTGRESTVKVRLEHEDMMAARVMAHNPAFGYGRPLGITLAGEVNDDDLKPAPGTDGLWIVYLWAFGLAGLSLQVVAQHFVPAWLALSHPKRRPGRAEVGAAEWGLAVFVLLALFDGLHNMPSFTPLPLIAGGLAAQAGRPRSRRREDDRERDRDHDRDEDDERDSGPEGFWDTTVRRGGFVLRPAAVSMGLACLLYVFGHGPVAGFEELKLVGGFGAALMFGAAGAAGSWASRRFDAWRLALFGVIFAVLGVSFNLALHPTVRPPFSADILQGLALCGLIVAFWRRAFGGSAWADALLAAAPVAAHLVLVPSLPVFLGSQYLYAGAGQAGGVSMFPVLPWLTLAALGGRALRESPAVDLASGVMLGLAAVVVVGLDDGRVLTQFSKFPMSLPYALASGAVVGLVFALGRFQGFQGPALWALKWLGERWAVFFYVHFAVVEAIQRAGVTEPGLVWASLAAGGIAATALVSLPAVLVAPGFRTVWPWLAVVGMIGAAAFAPGLNALTVTALAGSGGLVLAAFYPELAALIADFRATAPPPLARPQTSSSPSSSSREGAATRPAEPAGSVPAADSRWRMAARAGVLAVALASPEAVGWVGAKLSSRATVAAPTPAAPGPNVDPIQDEVERTQKAVDDLMRRPVPLQR